MTGSAELVRQLRADIRDERVLAAMAEVPRERFVAPEMRKDAWANTPLPIGSGQTISQPLVVARMLELLQLRPQDRVLDVGTGSGYHAALLARLARWVWSIERHASLSEFAAANLAAAGVTNVTLVVGDGTLGLPRDGPFDAINVAAAAPPGGLADLEGQLAPGGRLVAPLVNGDQRLVVVRRDASGGLERRSLERVRFVPLVLDECQGKNT
jgi:protein-L-isoaspartate(D-aspartate) O-methyltransferase